MPRKIHMQDQVSNRVEDIMSHHRRFDLLMWGIKGLVLIAFLMVVGFSGGSA